MKGIIVEYDLVKKIGHIIGDDGERYFFKHQDWKSSVALKLNQIIDFETDYFVDDNELIPIAKEMYLDIDCLTIPDIKKKKSKNIFKRVFFILNRYMRRK